MRRAATNEILQKAKKSKNDESIHNFRILKANCVIIKSFQKQGGIL